MATPARRPLDRVLHPDSVAVVGASTDPRKRGHQVVRALLGAGYGGRIHPVNPRGGTLLDLPVVPSLLELPEEPDLVVVATPAPTVPAILEEAAERRASGAVVLAGGFGEMGEEGNALESRVRSIARESGLRVVGPNCSGMVNTACSLDLIGVPGLPPGRIALLSQSGNAALALLNEAMESAGEGFSVSVGVGNGTDLAFHEYVEYLHDHSGTDVIMVYAEGFREGRAFAETAARVVRKKPVVLLRGGRSPAGGDAARSHTGAVATPHATVRAALRQAGVVEVTRTDELLPVARALVSVVRAREEGRAPSGNGRTPSENGPPSGNGSAVRAAAKTPATRGEGAASGPPADATPRRGVAILADGGGQATVAADTLSDLDVPLVRLEEPTRRRLRDLLGPGAAVTNPVDVAGACDQAPHLFGDAMEALLADPGVTGVLLVGLFGGYAIRFAPELAPDELEAAHRMVALARETGKPLAVHSIYSGRGAPPLLRLREAGVAVMDSLEVACRAAGAQWDSGRRLAAVTPPSTAARNGPAPNGAGGVDSRGPDANGRGPDADSGPMAGLLRHVAAQGRDRLLETEARELAEHYRVPLVPAHFCRTGLEVRTTARAHGERPLCIKVVSDTVTHKSDAGGVALNVRGPEEAARVCREMRASVTRYATERDQAADIRGFLVGAMAASPVAEVLVGMRRDPSFGPVLTLGAGGTQVEVHRDAVIRLLPVSRQEVHEMLDELRIAPVLRGHRGGPAANRDALADLVIRLAEAFLAHGSLAVLEANPVFAGAKRAMAVDLRAAVEPGAREAADPSAGIEVGAAGERP